MMYESKLACAVKVNNVLVREDRDKTYIPFGSEYSLYVKNLHVRKAIVTITIDGTPVCDGGIVVYPNSSIDIERFVKDNDKGNRFKFIERSGAVEQARGVGIEDGLIRVEFQFAKEAPRPIITWNPVDTQYRSTTKYFDNTRIGGVGTDLKGGNDILRSRRISASSASFDTTSSSVQTQSLSTSVNDAGITVPGSVSNQKFTKVDEFPLEDEKHVMVMHILGVTSENQPVEVVTPSRQKPKCVTCERVNKATAKFCTECGTSLIII